MSEPTMETLARRLGRVEGENRRLKGAGVVTLALIGGVMLMGQAAPPRAPKVVEQTPRSAGTGSGWTLNMGFENGTLGQECEGSDAFQYAGTRTVFSNTHVHSGSKSCRMEWLQAGYGGGSKCEDDRDSKCGYLDDRGDVSLGSFGGTSKITEGQEVWVRTWFYFDTGWSWSWHFTDQSNVIKGVRLGEESSTGQHCCYDSLMYSGPGRFNQQWIGLEGGTVINGQSASGNRLQNRNSPAEQPPTSQWYCTEMYIKFHNTRGIVRMWMEGELKVEETNINTMQGSGNRYYRMLWMSYWNGGAPQHQYQWLDDIKVTTNSSQATQTDGDGNKLIGCQ